MYVETCFVTDYMFNFGEGTMYAINYNRDSSSPTAKYWTEVRVSYGRVEGKIKGTEKGRNSLGRSTESTSLDTWELSETEPLSCQPQ